MKIGVIGLADFPLGKTKLPDERLGRLEGIFHPPKTTYIQVELADKDHLKESQVILCGNSDRLELIISDLEFIEERLPKITEDKQSKLLLRCKEKLEKDGLLNEIELSQEERLLLSNFPLLTPKPIYLVSGPDFSVPSLILAAYQMAGLISFFTVNEKELRAWSIKRGTTAKEAAGCIHSEIERGFIRAEVVGYENLMKAGGLNQAKAQGYLRIEGKDYVVQDGDLIKFRFSV